jgi:signal transduction histidine kinase
MMPRLDGAGLLRALRSNEATRTVPVLVLSARCGEEASVEALAAGADDYVYKPFSSRELLARIRTHLELASVRQKAVESRLKDDFLELAWHELNTPLAGLKLRVDATRRRLERSGAFQAAQQLAAVDRPIARIERLVRDMLDAGAVKEGKLPIHRGPCDLVEICRDAVASAVALFDRTVMLAAPTESVQASLDRDRVTEVVENLLLNALKFSPANRPVDLSLHASNREARIVVRDQGPGIPVDQIPRLFERHHQVPGIEVQSGSGVGFGLGLYIAKAIVEQHGGRIDVETSLGQGTAFRVTLPMGIA